MMMEKLSIKSSHNILPQVKLETENCVLQDVVSRQISSVQLSSLVVSDSL